MILCCCRGITVLLQRLTLNSHFSSLSTAGKVPAGALFLGRGASDQLGGGGGIEEKKALPISSYCLTLLLSPITGQLADNDNKQGVIEVGISSELFHSAILAHGGRLGFVQENPAFLPTLNPLLDSVHSIALGGIRSVPSLPLARFLRGAMVVSVRWGILCILENCSLDWCILLPSLTQLLMLSSVGRNPS